MKTASLLKRCFGMTLIVGALAWSGTALAAFKAELQGQDFTSTNWNGGPLNGWTELSFVPCRVELTGGPASNRNTIITLDHLIDGDFFDADGNRKRFGFKLHGLWRKTH